jgi:hypothetical protein
MFGLARTDAATVSLLLTLESAATALMAWFIFHENYGGERPLAVRMAQPRTLHDRVALIDKQTAWTVTQSFRDFAKRSPAEIVRADDTASLKIAAYEQIWSSATIIV